MRPTLAGLVAVLLCGCAMSPKVCREFGVNVPDGARPTGTYEEHIAHRQEVSARCGFPTRGCAIPVAPGDWVIWSVDDTAVRTHEQCHALYSEGNHN